MLHKAWNSKGEMPYRFPRSSVKFQGHTVQNITDFDPNWAFPDYRPVAAFKSLRFALFSFGLNFYFSVILYDSISWFSICLTHSCASRLIHGFISKRAAETILKSCKNANTFLLRFRESSAEKSQKGDRQGDLGICLLIVDNKGEYRQVSNIRRTLVGNKIVDHSDVVGASPVGAAPTTSSFST